MGSASAGGGAGQVGTALFSVLVPTYNQATFLPDALESLLAQSYPHWEAVVVDDGSTDDTRDILRRYASRDPRIRGFHKENGGVASALNEGIRNARGDWLCWLSSDDWFEPDALRIYSETIRRHPDVRFFFSGFFRFDEATGRRLAPRYRPPRPEYRVIRFFLWNFVHGIAVAVHRSVFEEVGPFDERLRYAQDVDMWLRICARHRSVHIDRRTCVTRVHRTQGTTGFPEGGIFDTARSCAEFLNARSYPELFPLLDLRNRTDAMKAAVMTLRIALSPKAHVNRCGFNPSLLRRFREWLSWECSPGVKAVLAPLLGAAVRAFSLAPLPEEIQEELRRLRRGGIPGYRFEPRDFRAAAEGRARTLALVGREAEAGALIRYLDGNACSARQGNAAHVNVGMVTFNRLAFTRQAIDAVVRCTGYPYVLTVVDNGSTDGTREFLRQCRERGIIRTLVLLPRNVGVAKAANLSWRVEPDAGYYLKLDNDIVLRKPGWLAAMVEVADRIPEAGAVAYNFEPKSYPLRDVGGIGVRVKEKGKLGGACILIPKRTEVRVGYWCEEYGPYAEEDRDYGVRVSLSGMFNLYMGDEEVGDHLPAGRASVVDRFTLKAADGIEEALEPEYRAWKDTWRRRNAGFLGPYRRNERAYRRRVKPVYVESQFVVGLKNMGLDPAGFRGKTVEVAEA